MIRLPNISDSVQGRARCASLAARSEKKTDDRGVALILTLLLLFLMSIIGLVAVLSTSSDLLINGYYSNFRGSFYAADSGLNMARQLVITNMTPAPGGFDPAWYCVGNVPQGGAGPLTTTSLSGLNTVVNNTYGSSTALTGANTGIAANSWAESFKIIPSLSPSTFTATCGPANSAPTSYQYVYNYSLVSVGTATGSEQSTVTENGAIIVNISIGTPPTTESFAQFGAFVTNYPPCLGPLVPGTMTGRMYTGGEWGFMPGGQYIFTGAVQQAMADASYFDSNWNCYQSPNPSFTAPNGQTIAPGFEDGFVPSFPAVTQPANDFSQKWAAIDGMGCGENNGNTCTPPQNPPQGYTNPSVIAPTQAQMAANLQTVTGTPYPATGAPPTSGVYLNYGQNSSGQNVIKGGGLYIEGNASIVVSTSGASGQVYTITQGTAPNTTVTTMTVDTVANTTTIQQGTNPPLVLNSAPENTSTNPPVVGTMIYVDGTIASLQGTAEGAAAIQNNSAVTIVAAGDINLTGDLRYATEPVSTAPGPNLDQLVPAMTDAHGNLTNTEDLGIFSVNGSIYMSQTAPGNDGNLWIDGSQAVLGTSGACGQGGSSCGFYVGNSCPNGQCNAWPAGGNYQGSCLGTVNNVGGQLQTNIFGACLNTENTYYDQRYTQFSKQGFAPPWFPGFVAAAVGNPSVAVTNTTLQRTSWVASSGQ